MNWQTIVNQQFVGNIGWTLLHSLWQISLAAFLLFTALRIVKNASANLRYLVCVAALFAAFVSPILTFISFSNNSAEKIGTSLEKVEKNISTQANIVQNNRKLPNDLSQIREKVQVDENNSIFTFENIQAQVSNLFTNLIPYFVCMWLFGILFFTFRFGGGIWQTHKLKTNQSSIPEARWIAKFEELCEKVGISFKINFFQTEVVETPMVIGWLKPFVIVPSSVLLGLDPQELETIIAHELIHIRRHDYLVNILQSFIEIVLFFHPLMWWISTQVRRERENACDDEVLQMFDSKPLLYANALANLEEFRFQSANVLPSNALAANGGNLMFRIQRIIKNAGMKNSKGSIWSSGMAFLLAFGISVIMFSASLFGGFSSSSNETTTRIDAKRIAIALYSNSQYLIIDNIEDADKTMELLTNNLKSQKIPVVGYAAGYSGNIMATDGKVRNEKIVELWRNAGFEIGANFMKLPKSYNLTLEQYKIISQNEPSFTTNIINTSSIMKKMREQTDYLINKYGDITNLSPEKKEEFLKERENFKQEISEEDRQKLNQEVIESMKLRQENQRKWLKANNLTSVTFTINAVDWMYSNIYDSARNSNDKKLMRYVQDNYLEYLSKIFDYYENVSQQKYNRKIPQTFGLEPSRLTADSIDRIVEMLKKRGYEFISMDDALTDEVFQTSDSYGFGGRSSFFDAYPFPNKSDLTNKPKPHEDIMTRWYEKESKK